MRLWHALLLLTLALTAWLLTRCDGPQQAHGVQDDRVAAAIGDAADAAEEAEALDPVRAEVPVGEPHDPERDLIGIVVDVAGNPIANAALSAWLQQDRHLPGLSVAYESIQQEAARAMSDAAGHFRMRLEPHLIYDLLALKDGFARTRLPNLYTGIELRVVMPAAASISGIITDDAGVPLADVDVMATQGTVQIPGDEFFYAFSDSNGEYRLDDLPPNFYRLRFDRAHYARKYDPTLALHEGERARVDQTLHQGATLRGRVTDGDTGQPIEGAEVGLRIGSHPALTDANGNYLLTGIPIGYHDSLIIRATGYGRYDFPLLDVPAEGLEQDFGLLRGRTARGRIVNRQGQPIEDAAVVAASFAYKDSSSQGDRRTSSTGADGVFLLTDLRIDLRHTLLVHADGYAAAIYDFPAEEWAQHEIELGELILEPSCTLAGVVVDTQGRPLPGLWVAVSGEPFRRDALHPSQLGGEGYMDRGGLGFGSFSAPTDAKGRFAFAGLPSGSYYLSAGSKGYARRADLELDLLYEGEQVTDLRLVLDVGLSLSGRVVDRAGNPIPAASVSVHPSSSPNERTTYNLSREDGSFSLVGLSAGSYLVLVESGFSGQHYAPVVMSEVIAGTVDLRIVLSIAASISGTVLDARNQPVHQAHVQVWEEGGMSRHLACNADRDGRFTLWLPEGEPVTLMACPLIIVGADGSADMSRNVYVRDVMPGTADLVIRLE